MLLDAGLLGDGKVIILQPRRLPARMLAARVAHERHIPPSARKSATASASITSPAPARASSTSRKASSCARCSPIPALPGITAILFDEFHERHLYGDITLARALQIQESTRPDLRLIVMSATLETAHLRQIPRALRNPRFPRTRLPR